MKQKTFAIMGATGHIGRVICEDLIKRGHIVRAIGRDEDKLHKLDLKGANLVFSEFDDVEILSDAFKDCFAIFCMIPPTLQEENYSQFQDRVSEAICQSIQNSGVQRVVNLSSLGADLKSGTGPITGLSKNEQRLNKLNNLKSLIHLRPSFFMENLNMYLPMIFSNNVIRTPIDINLPIPMVATRDIGWKAADFLDSTAIFNKCEFEFLGPKDVTFNYVTELLAQYLEMPELYCEQASYEEAKEWMVEEGISSEAADLMIEMYKAFNSGQIVAKKSDNLTHHGSTTIEAYLLHLAHRHFQPMHS